MTAVAGWALIGAPSPTRCAPGPAGDGSPTPALRAGVRNTVGGDCSGPGERRGTPWLAVDDGKPAAVASEAELDSAQRLMLRGGGSAGMPGTVFACPGLGTGDGLPADRWIGRPRVSGAGELGARVRGRSGGLTVAAGVTAARLRTGVGSCGALAGAAVEWSAPAGSPGCGKSFDVTGQSGTGCTWRWT